MCLKTEIHMKIRNAFIMNVFSNDYTPICFNYHTCVANLFRSILIRPNIRNVFYQLDSFEFIFDEFISSSTTSLNVLLENNLSRE